MPHSCACASGGSMSDEHTTAAAARAWGCMPPPASTPSSPPPRGRTAIPASSIKRSTISSPASTDRGGAGGSTPGSARACGRAPGSARRASSATIGVALAQNRPVVAQTAAEKAAAALAAESAKLTKYYGAKPARPYKDAFLRARASGAADGATAAPKKPKASPSSFIHPCVTPLASVVSAPAVQQEVDAKYYADAQADIAMVKVRASPPHLPASHRISPYLLTSALISPHLAVPPPSMSLAELNALITFFPRLRRT